jgi:hypothetical protein
MALILDGTNGLSDVDGSAATPAIRGSDANTGVFFGADIIGFSEGGTECARFNADAQFVAAAGTASLPVITTTGDVNTGIFFPAADTIAFAEGGAEAMRIDSSGNLLVGSTSVPSPVSNYKALVVGGSTGGIVDIGTTSTSYGRVSADSVGLNLESLGATTTIFRTNNTERARITSGGNLLVGATSDPGNGPAKIGILNTGQTDYGMVIKNTNALLNDAVAFFNDSGTRVGVIQFTTTATTYGTSSDYRLKHDIQPMTGALAKVAQLKPVTYKWNADDSQSQGFIAHELQEVVPECVTGEKDAVDAEGNPQYQGIDTSFLVATLAAAIQELKGINDAQAQIITALTARVEALEGAQA